MTSLLGNGALMCTSGICPLTSLLPSPSTEAVPSLFLIKLSLHNSLSQSRLLFHILYLVLWTEHRQMFAHWTTPWYLGKNISGVNSNAEFQTSRSSLTHWLLYKTERKPDVVHICQLKRPYFQRAILLMHWNNGNYSKLFRVLLYCEF